MFNRCLWKLLQQFLINSSGAVEIERSISVIEFLPKARIIPFCQPAQQSDDSLSVMRVQFIGNAETSHSVLAVMVDPTLCFLKYSEFGVLTVAEHSVVVSATTTECSATVKKLWLQSPCQPTQTTNLNRYAM